MKQTKLMIGSDPQDLEYNLNIWIKEHNTKINIVNVTSSLSYSSLNNKFIIVTILYENKEELTI